MNVADVRDSERDFADNDDDINNNNNNNNLSKILVSFQTSFQIN